jgi:hypothetical protein
MEQLKCAPLWLDPALPKNIRLGWTRFSGTNALAYYENLLFTAVKSFITLAQGHALSGENLIKTFFFVIDDQKN